MILCDWLEEGGKDCQRHPVPGVEEANSSGGASFDPG